MVTIHKLHDKNEENQIDFTGALTFRKHKVEYQILATVACLTHLPHAQVYKNCDTHSNKIFRRRLLIPHGIPRAIRHDQGQAYKSPELEIFCKDQNIKLLLAPALDHRATGMVES